MSAGLFTDHGTANSLAMSARRLRRGNVTNGKLAILTFPIQAATIVRAFTNPRVGKIEFVNAVANRAQ